MSTKKSKKKSTPKKAPSNGRAKKKTTKPVSNSRRPPTPTRAKATTSKRPGKPSRKSPTKVRPTPVRKSTSSNRIAKKAPTLRASIKRPSITRDAAKLAKETRKTSRIVSKNIQATKKAAKVLRDAFGRFTKAVKKASKKATKNAAKQSRASSKAKKTPTKNPKRESTPQQKATKAAPKTSSVVQGHRGQGQVKGNQRPGRHNQDSKRGGDRARPQRATREPKTPKPPKGVKAGKPSYTLQELASSKAKNLAKLLKKIEENADAIDQLKRPEQLWTFQIYDRHSLVVYESISGMMEFLQASGGLVVAEQENAGLFAGVQILTRGEESQTMDETTKAYRQEVLSRQAARRAENAKIMKDIGKMFGRVTPQGRRKSKYELLSEAIAEVEKLKAEARMKKEGVKSRRKIK